MQCLEWLDSRINLKVDQTHSVLASGKPYCKKLHNKLHILSGAVSSDEMPSISVAQDSCIGLKYLRRRLINYCLAQKNGLEASKRNSLHLFGNFLFGLNKKTRNWKRGGGWHSAAVSILASKPSCHGFDSLHFQKIQRIFWYCWSAAAGKEVDATGLMYSIKPT